MSRKNGKPKVHESIKVAGDNTDAQTTAMDINPRRRSRSEIKEQILKEDPTSNYRSTRYTYYGELFVQRLPLWRLWTARMMLTSDPIINFSLNVRNAALMATQIKIKARSPKVQQWLQKQWHYLWNHHRPKLVSAKKWGFGPLQCLFKYNKNTGLIDISGVKDFAPEDCRALEVRNKLCGMRVKGAPIFHPQCLWMKFGEEFGSQYGTAVTRRQYPAWYEKWMDHGAKRLIQLRMIKDAYIGDIFWYPPNILARLPDGTEMSWRDLMREIAENRLSGGALTLPMLLDANGKELTKYQPPQTVPGASEVFNWVDYCDDDILKGADVPLEVVKASDTGSGFSGRSIPFLVLLSVCNNEIVEIVECIVEQVLRPLAWLNWGNDVEFEMEPDDLVKTFSGNIGGSSLAGGSIGGDPSQQQPIQVPQQQPQGNVQFDEEGLTHTHAHYGGKHQWVFKKGKEEVGEIAIHHRPDNHYEVSNVLVWPKHQHKGYATKFYQHAQQHAASEGKRLHISNDRTEDAKALHKHFEKKGILNPHTGEINFGSQHAEQSVEFKKQGSSKHLQAPPGGVTIHGVKYKGGEFIPKEVMESLSPEDQHKLRAGSIARHIKARPELAAESKKSSKVPVKQKQPSARVARALASHNPSTKEKQDASEAWEKKMAKVLKLHKSDNNRPMDMTTENDNVGIELKVMHDAKEGRVNMRPDSRKRKEDWLKQKPGRKAFTVLVDNRDEFQNGAHKDKYSGTKYYYKEGVGAFRLDQMNKAKSLAHLKQLLEGQLQ